MGGGGGMNILDLFGFFFGVFFPSVWLFFLPVYFSFHHELRKSIMNIVGQNKNKIITSIKSNNCSTLPIHITYTSTYVTVILSFLF